ncbi:polysaccharide biosynthesis protein [Candidatus Marinimicrobia bacterium]|nr:polysaccharide biosynthesis protein [Candidatus Neomarinimicrobiota bacterium]
MKLLLNKYVSDMPRIIKRLIVMINDFLIISIVLKVLIFLFYSGNYHNYLISFISISTLILFSIFNIYDNVIRFISIKSLAKIALITAIPFIIYSLFFLELDSKLLEIFLLSYFVSVSLISLSRFLARSLIYIPIKLNREKIAILLSDKYLEKKDEQMIESIIDSNKYEVIAMLSYETKFKGLILHGIKVIDFSELEELIKKNKLGTLFIPSDLNNTRIRNSIYDNISSYPLKVVEIPEIEKMVLGKNNLNILKNLSIEDIVDRSVEEKIKIPESFFESKTVLVTGGGGSIGSVLCKEIASNNPKKLIVLDSSEIALFNIKNELDRKFHNIVCEYQLIDLKDKISLSSFLTKNKIDILYHSAAYKHVGLVEKNLSSAIKNNIGGFQNVLDCVVDNKIKNLTLISTDKAVDPTTAMGMTKRICEKMMIHQQSKNKSLKFSAVRFGNVFNSSGSVISIFTKQIQQGENLTITNADATRYFMSIKEAAHLVVKSSFLSQGGELFILDMGKPIKIFDIAKKMIHLSGKTMKSKSNPNGEINIDIIGLLDSEKVHEKLSTSKLKKTKEKKIYLSEDLKIHDKNFEIKLEEILFDVDNKRSTIFDKLSKLSKN